MVDSCEGLLPGAGQPLAYEDGKGVVALAAAQHPLQGRDGDLGAVRVSGDLWQP